MKAVTVDESHTRDVEWWWWWWGCGWGKWVGGGGTAIGSVIAFACTDTSNVAPKQRLTHDFVQSVLPLVCHLLCSLNFSYRLSPSDSCRAKRLQPHIQVRRLLYKTSPTCIDSIVGILHNLIASLDFLRFMSEAALWVCTGCFWALDLLSAESACWLYCMFYMRLIE